MKILVAGATGATGSRLVDSLLNRNHHVKVIVRSPERFRSKVESHANLEVVGASLLELTDEEMAELVAGCDAAVSCLGHNITFKGMYGHPRKLVTDAVRRLCGAVKANRPERPVKVILMNTVGNRNRDLKERVSVGERIIDGMLRAILAPHRDNIAAAKFLRTQIGQNDPVIQWVAVRPDTLMENEEVTEYELHPSPTSSAIFGSRKTSRINVADFMADLVADDQLWDKWKGQMPVIYNQVD